jgi:hypothetical protein
MSKPMFLARSLALISVLAFGVAGAVPTPAPAVSVCQPPPGSSAAIYDAYNDTHDHYPTTRLCFPSGGIRLWAQDSGSMVTGFTLNENGSIEANLTIMRNDGSGGTWVLLAGRSQPNHSTFVQTWTFNIVNGVPVDMKLVQVSLFDEHLALMTLIDFADDGVHLKRVEHRFTSNEEFSVELYRDDGTVSVRGSTPKAGGGWADISDVVEHSAAEKLHFPGMPAAWTSKPNIDGIPMPSESH